ncbi:DUF6973 domain-containing protein [Flagellimonas sp. S174]|uniref:DUF6973 domain-containing protein n=1 Tax=Flagellimonas sp. S174 TaxID=3410790 RepID=UPI003BF619BD
MGARSIWRVFLLGIKHPFFVLPTLSATKKCLKLSTKLYGKAHHQNGPANAFRHALWNYLIAKACFYWKPNPEKVQVWAKKLTDWHEEAFVNSPLARAMDLHNNAVGRYFFSKYISEPWEEVVDRLVDLTKESILVLSEKEIDQNQMLLVHIIETE